MKGRENPIKADKIRDELYFSFVNDCVTKRKFEFFDPIKKINPDRIEKNENNSESSFNHERNRLAFGVVLGGRSGPRRGFSVRVKSVLLSLAFPDSALQNLKHPLHKI